MTTVQRAAILCAVLLIATSCEQSNRYEISKDQAGRTLRLDRKTGEIALVEGDKLVRIVDARDVEAKQRKLVEDVGSMKSWPHMDLTQFDARCYLQTTWRDGKVFYSIRLLRIPTAEGRAANDRTPFDPKSQIRMRKFHLLLEDAPFELAKHGLSLSRIVDDQGKATGYEAKGNLEMSVDSYKRIDSWNLEWNNP